MRPVVRARIQLLPLVLGIRVESGADVRFAHALANYNKPPAGHLRSVGRCPGVTVHVPLRLDFFPRNAGHAGPSLSKVPPSWRLHLQRGKANRQFPRTVDSRLFRLALSCETYPLPSVSEPPVPNDAEAILILRNHERNGLQKELLARLSKKMGIERW